MRVVQIVSSGKRRVGLVDGERLRLLGDGAGSDVYSLAMGAVEQGQPLQRALENAVGSESVDYNSIYEGRSEWRLLPPFDHPGDAAHCLISGTGLTHKASAENRAAMHKRGEAEITDSIRMYQWGLEGGSPEPGQIGIQPEWFYKGDGSILRAHCEILAVPAYGWDGGEEPEIVGVYIVARNGDPYRVGLTQGNEFSDHRMEKKNYLYLAPSKLRNCSIGPELAVGEIEFDEVPGTVAIWRNNAVLWKKNIWSGQKNMSYSVANLEHHHFKYEAHRRPGDAHIHFFGADAFSFGDGVLLEPGDVMEVSFLHFGRALRNTLSVDKTPEALVTVKIL
ncbi:MAG: GguC protein [Acidobacteriaceae bacterium]|nr:GguC protein [Acidobacteriaceae bacterium]